MDIFLNNQEDIVLGDHFFCILADNQEEGTLSIKREIEASYIQFHFLLQGKADFLFNNGTYKLNIEEAKYLMLYNPMQELPVNIAAHYRSNLITILISISKFHDLFSSDTHNISFLNKENINQKYYKEHIISQSMYLILSQMFTNVDPKNKRNSLYLKAKTYELFSLMFPDEGAKDTEQCPFIMNDDHIKKVKLAKDIITTRFDNPPTLIELSEEVKLSLKKLKQGFKEVYGNPVFQYLLEYKMNLATKLLLTGKYNVNEVSIKLGYSTASHFIAAFKRRFSITPKQYTMNR